MHSLGHGRMPRCVDCGADHVFTLVGALMYGLQWTAFEEATWIPAPEKAALHDAIRRLERYSLQRWGRRLDLQTVEDIPRELCRLSPALRMTIPGLGTYDDLDAAYALPASQAVAILGEVRPYELPTVATGHPDRWFMEVAIHEARQSVGEEGRANPKVGAVIVKAGVVLATAYRGELGKGEHAEYTAIHRKLAGQSLAGATIYTTLEPCTTRNHPKKPCATWIIESEAARVLIGMLDPNPAIRGLGERSIRGHGIEVDRFPHDLILQLEELNRDFTNLHS
jgi:pyrimidine deaminase RibD-like protein